MIRCTPVSLDQDLLRVSLDHTCDACVLIYPTRTNARKAQQLFQRNWSAEELIFISIEGFKQTLISSGMPLIQDDKRMLCLYQSLTDDDRSYYHIDTYDDMVEWGGHWFELMQELREECFNTDLLRKPEQLTELYLQEWQLKSIPRILAIRDQYKLLITDKGFDDLIFVSQEQSINPDPRFNRYVFVNQYYFTALEKLIIKTLEERGNQVIILHQGLESWFDPYSLESTEFDLEQTLKAGRYSLKSLNIMQTGTRDEQYLQFLSDRAQSLSISGTDQDIDQAGQSRAIIDRGFGHKAHAALFDPVRFSIPHSYSITQTRLFQSLNIISQMLIHLISDESATYLPVKDLAALATDAGLCNLWNMTDADRDHIQYLLAQLSDEDVLYLDLEGTFFAIREQRTGNTQPGKIDLCPLKDYLSKVSDLFHPFLSATSISAIIDVLNSDRLPLNRICSKDELAYTDILEKVHERFANIQSIESMGIVKDWHAIFPPNSSCLASDLITLLLKIIRSANVSYHVPAHDLTDFSITDIQDSRNLSYDQTVFFNVIEGEYPTKPSSVWLFSENQRARLGLLSWEDVRRRERYYFFRLLLSSRQAVLFTYHDQEKSIEQSSFIGEIIALARDWKPGQDLPDCLGQIAIQYHKPSSNLIRDWFYRRYPILMKSDTVGADSNTPNITVGANTVSALSHKSPQDVEWIRRYCSIPYDAKDFGKNRMVALSYYKLAAFTDDPFMWFVEHHCGISSRRTDSPLQIGRRFFGTILHEYLRTILAKVVAEYAGKLKGKWQWYNEGFLLKTLINLLSRQDFSFKLPLNYNREFIREVIIPALISAARHFLHDILPHLPIKFKDEVTIIPEEQYNADNPLQYKQFIQPSEETEGVSVIIRCIADLRVENLDEAVIIDFKTGSFQGKDQLVMYYWYYYVLNEDYNRKVTGMYINPLSGDKDSWDLSIKRRDALYTKVKGALVSIINTGYGTAHTRKLRERNYQITRADLTTLQGGDDESDD